MKQMRYIQFGVCFCFFYVVVGLILTSDAASQIITEFASGLTAECHPRGVTAGPDGNIWFTEDFGNKIGKITPSGVVTEFSSGLPLYSYPGAITIGPDGNLWFTVYAGIGRITPAGTITIFSNGLQYYSNPLTITTGPDGNLWFTDCGTNSIGRITPSGDITEFLINYDNSSPWGIAAGPDGHIWFTDYGADAIGRINPFTGTITKFSDGLSVYCRPAEITVGPDGNLWFTEYDGRKIGRITPTGTIVEFSSGLPSNSNPCGIVSGPDGNLWFTDFGANAIGKITPSGTITEFVTGLSADSDPLGITTGPDGNLWFTEYAGDQIGRVSDVTTGCMATLDNSFVLNIPLLFYIEPISGPLSLWANLIYEFNSMYPELIFFKLTTYGLIDNPSFTCLPSTLSDEFLIHIPDVLLNDGITHLWVDLQYSQMSSINGSHYFFVKDYGYVSSNRLGL